jgi:hypothetical protein
MAWGDNSYNFVTRWRVQGTVEEVGSVLDDARELPRWWPSVYLDINILQAGDENHVGEVFDLFTKGLLPYTLRWRMRVAEVERHRRIVIEASGDFVGQGIWTFEPDGEFVNITYEWKIRAEKPLLRRLSFLVKPVFEANHLWAMRRGEESLKLELLRRRAKTPEERAKIPAPPRPTFR